MRLQLPNGKEYVIYKETRRVAVVIPNRWQGFTYLGNTTRRVDPNGKTGRAVLAAYDRTVAALAAQAAKVVS